MAEAKTTTKKTGSKKEVGKPAVVYARIRFIRPVLGSEPADPDIYDSYIASNAEEGKDTSDEHAAVERAKAAQDELSDEEKSVTVFYRDEEDNPILMDYQLKGFFKEACKMMKFVEGSFSGGLAAHKTKIDGLIFPYPRDLKLNYEGEMKNVTFKPVGEDKQLLSAAKKRKLDTCQRPLRAETAQGPRIALACSEMLPSGTWFDVAIECLSDYYVPFVKEWLDYGKFKGIGQWRNSGKGRFVWEEIEPFEYEIM